MLRGTAGAAQAPTAAWRIETPPRLTFMTVSLSALCNLIANVCFRIQRQAFTLELGIHGSHSLISAILPGFSPPTGHALLRLD